MALATNHLRQNKATKWRCPTRLPKRFGWLRRLLDTEHSRNESFIAMLALLHPHPPSNRLRRHRQPRDAVEYASKQASRHSRLGQLERHVPRVPGRLGPDLDQLLAQRRQGSVPYRIRQRQPTQEVAQVVGQYEQLQPHLVVIELVARQTRPVQRVLALLDPLLS